MNRSIVVLAALLALALSSVAFAAKTTTQKTSGTAWMGANHTEGDDVYVGGDFKDKVLGRGTVVYVVRANSDTPGEIKLTAKVTLSTLKGSFTGKGAATQVVATDGAVTIKDGTLDLKGVGGYKGKRFTADVTGTYTDGVYTFDYTGAVTTKRK